jgi:hypothetical protein
VEEAVSHGMVRPDAARSTITFAVNDLEIDPRVLPGRGPGPLPGYVSRTAIAGSTRAARTAGATHAIKATAASTRNETP